MVWSLPCQYSPTKLPLQLLFSAGTGPQPGDGVPRLRDMPHGLPAAKRLLHFPSSACCKGRSFSFWNWGLTRSFPQSKGSNRPKRAVFTPKKGSFSDFNEVFPQNQRVFHEFQQGFQLFVENPVDGHWSNGVLLKSLSYKDLKQGATPSAHLFFRQKNPRRPPASGTAFPRSGRQSWSTLPEGRIHAPD